MQTNSLLTLKDDMIAFIEGHGMFRFKGYVDENVPTVSWDDDENPDSWKDFVEAAKAAGAQFLTSPGLDIQIVEFALKEGVLAMPGALTPTEITEASRADAQRRASKSGVAYSSRISTG